VGCSDRQIKAMLDGKATRQLTTQSYMALAGTTRATAKRDLDDLVVRGLLVAAGAGRGAHYAFARNRPNNGSIGSSASGADNGS